MQGYEFLRFAILKEIDNDLNSDDAPYLLTPEESIFDRLEAKLGRNSPVEAVNLPKITEVGRDIKDLICNTEIAEALANLEQILAKASDRELLSQLQTQIAIFLDLGTILGIPEFVTIAQTSLATLEASPQTARNIGQLAKVGFNSALQAVLNYNPTTEISREPSERGIFTEDAIEEPSLQNLDGI